MLPFEKKTIRIYLFYFKDYEKPLMIEAIDLKTAMEYLIEETNKFYGHIENIELENMKIITPIYGITEKECKGTVLVWSGFENSVNGWLPREDFNKLKKFD